MFMGGGVAMDAHDYALAETLFAPIRLTYSDTATLDSQLALAQYRQGHLEKSEKTLLEAMQSQHANTDVYLLLCKVLTDRGASARALQVAAEGTHAFPDSYQLFLTKAAAEMKLRYFSQAVNTGQRAVELHSSAETKRELALAEWRAGNRKQASSDFEETLRHFPRDTGTYEAYGTLLLEDGSPESKARAIELLKKAITGDDSSVEARYQLANIELADGHFQPAFQYLERAIRMNPDDSRLHFAMARIYRRLGRDSEADREMERYQKLKAADAQH
jgi:tetratricopeptide (TPR) repeat protein